MADAEKSNLKTNIFLAIFLIIIIIITILSIIFPNVGTFFAVGNWFPNLEQVNYWIAIAFVIILCFLGALIPIPIPYMLPVALFTAAWIKYYDFAWLLIIGLIFFSALSNTVGDLLDYYIGRGTEYVLSKENPDIENRWSKIILYKPKLIPGVIVLFGVSPLPESLLMVPLGIVKYDVKKTFFWMFIGKTMMMSIMVVLGILGLESLLSGDNPLLGIVVLYIIWFIIAFMVKYKPSQ